MDNILITVRPGLRRPNISRIRQRFEKSVKELGSIRGEVSVLLTNDAEVKTLNSHYRSINRPTDVLSFPFTEDGNAGADEQLGDIVISLPYAERQAKEIGNSFEREVLFLMLHGLLHLVGYDHEQGSEQAEEMEAMQRRLMKAGYGR